MDGRRVKFRNRIYGYCDDNMGDVVSFTMFRHLWPIPRFVPLDEISHEGDLKSYKVDKILPLVQETAPPRDITVLTSRILSGLQAEGIIKEVVQENTFQGFYPRYEVLDHSPLIDPKNYRNV